MSNIYAKLALARDTFHNLELTKTGHNKFAGYKYFELGDFLIPAMKCLQDAGLITLPVNFTQKSATMTLHEIEGEGVIEFTSPMVPTEYHLTDKDGNTHTMNVGANLRGCHPIQNLGAVETYQRRYLWVSLMEIVEHDALDATAGSEPSSKAPQAKKPAAPKPKPTAKAKASVATLKPKAAPKPAAPKAEAKAEPVEQKEVEEDFYLETEGDAKEFAEFMITTATEMHSGSMETLVDFWQKNTHATDYLAKNYPEQYETVKTSFSELKNTLIGDSE